MQETPATKPSYVILNSIYLNNPEILFLQNKTEELPVQQISSTGQIASTKTHKISGKLTKLEIFFFLQMLAYVQREYYLAGKPRKFEPVFHCKSLNEFLRKVGRSNKGRNYEKAKSALFKLRRIFLSFENKERCFGYEILKSFDISRAAAGEMKVVFNKDWFLSQYDTQYNKVPLILFELLGNQTPTLFLLFVLQNKHLWVKEGNFYGVGISELKQKIGISEKISNKKFKYQLKTILNNLKQMLLIPEDYLLGFFDGEILFSCEKEEPHDLNKYKSFWGIFSC